jgi:hypothetical protein
MGLHFPRLPHSSDISIEGEICSLHDGITLHGPSDKSCYSSFVKFAHGGEVGKFVVVIVFLFFQLLLEFIKLVEIVETRGLRILRNVNTRWISMLELLKWVMVEYKTLIVNMSQDKVQSRPFL